MKRYIRFFFNPIEDRERFLNDMASKGLQLEESGTLVHKFSESNTSNIHYSVQYIGNVSNRERQDYMDFVRNLNLRVFFAPFNVGKFAIGNVKYRPFNKGFSSVVTAPGMINREIMIIESKGDDQIPVFTDGESRYEALLQRRMPYIYLAIASIILIILGVTQSQGSLFEKTLVSFRPLEKYPWLWTVIGCLLLLSSLASLYRLYKIAKKK